MLSPDLHSAQQRGLRSPHTGMDGQLAPVEFQWTGRTNTEICAQMRDSNRNGGRDAPRLITHILHDVELIRFITWSFNPGAGKSSAPGSIQSHLENMAV